MELEEKQRIAKGFVEHLDRTLELTKNFGLGYPIDHFVAIVEAGQPVFIGANLKPRAIERLLGNSPKAYGPLMQALGVDPIDVRKVEVYVDGGLSFVLISRPKPGRDGGMDLYVEKIWMEERFYGLLDHLKEWM